MQNTKAMQTLPKRSVSVIVPTYNRAAFLPIAIQSLFEQSFQNIEIIVVDDGSTDETKVVLEPLMDKIKYITTEHKGTAHARNTGMKAATGEYIAFLDSDDLYLPHKLELQVAFMEDHPEVDMVCTEFSGVDIDGNIDEFHMRDYHPIWKRMELTCEDIFSIQGKCSPVSVGEEFTYYIGNIFKFVLMDTLFPTNTVLLRKKILKNVGYQNESYRYLQEYEFFLRICKNHMVGFINTPTYMLYYHHAQSTNFITIEGEKTKQEVLKRIEVLSILLSCVLDWGYADKAYYKKNKNLVNCRFAELYCIIGVEWLEYGDQKKARKSFQSSYKFAFGIKAPIFWWFSFIPGILRRFMIKKFLKLERTVFLKLKRTFFGRPYKKRR